MNEESNQTSQIPKIRTFAADFKASKGQASETKPKPDLPSKKVTDIPKYQPEPTKPKIPIPKLNKKTTETKTVKSTPEKTEVKKPQAAIPAYHELQKTVDRIDNQNKANHVKPAEPIRVKKPIIKRASKKTTRKKPNLGYEATIITDTKQHNPDFFPAVIKSLSDWVQKILTPKEKAAPKYTVAESSTRKGVIQKATTKTGSIFTADNESLKEQIRKRRLEESAAAKQAADPAETVWSPYTETGYDLIEPPHPEQAKDFEVPKVPDADNRTVTQSPQSPESLSPEADFDEQRWSNPPENAKPKHMKSSYPDTHQSAKPKPPEKTAPTSEREEKPTVPKPVTKKIPTFKPAEPSEKEGEATPETKKSKVDFGDNIDKVDTNTMSVVVLMIIIGLVSLVLVGRLVYQYINTSMDNDEVSHTLIDPTLDNSQIINLPLTSSDLNNLPELIDEARQNSSEIILEIALTDTTGQELSPAYIFELLDLSMMPTMKQSINQVRFISLDNKEEVILLTFNSEENVRGGFLNWENDLSADLAKLYNYSVSDAAFVDQSIAGMDARQIDIDGTSLTYSIVNDNTALISISSTDLERIINLEFNP